MRFVTYEDLKGEWRWRAISTNGRIIADSAEGYVSKSNARRALIDFVRACARGDFEPIDNEA